MRGSTRFAVLTVVAAIPLGLAETALAIYKPYATIWQSSYAKGATPSEEIDYDQQDSEPAPYKVTIFVPAAEGFDLSQAQGTNIGYVLAQVKTSDSSSFVGAKIPLSGPITTTNPADPNIVTKATACTPSQPAHQAVWTLNLIGAGQTLVVPAYVDKLAAGMFAGTIVFCLPNPYDSGPNGAPFGASAVNVSMTIRSKFHVFKNPTAASFYTWSYVVTPWTQGSPGNPNAAATVEARANVPIPYSNTLRRVATKNGSWFFAGTLTGGGGPFVKERLDVFAGAKVSKMKLNGRTGRTGKKGGYTFSRKAGRTARYFQTVFGPFDVTDPATCGAPPAMPGVPCATATLSEVDSNIVKAPGVKPKKKKKH